MQADAVIFDKDGTLMDFDAFWVAVCTKATERFLQSVDRADIPLQTLLEAFGVQDGVADVDGVLCKGTYAQMGEIMHRILRGHGCDLACDEITARMVEIYADCTDAGVIQPTCSRLPEVLGELKRRGKKLAVVTTDNEDTTKKCLEALHVAQLFDRIYTDDGEMSLKPHPCCAEDFSWLTGVDTERMVMVGDTVTDALFAENVGMPMVALAQNERSGALLKGKATAIISDLSELLDILE